MTHFTKSCVKHTFVRLLQNKFWYGVISLATIPARVINHMVNLRIDGKEVPIPKGTKSVVVANINSFASGMRLWKLKKNETNFSNMRFDDGTLEVVAFTGVVHLGLATGGVKRPKPLGQGAHIEINCVIEPYGVQLDGEPLEFTSPTVITLRHKSQFKTVTNVQKLKKQ